MRKMRITSSGNSKRSRKIMAATYLEDIHPDLSDVENEAYHAGYTLIAEGDNLENAVLTLKADRDEDIMPKITIWLDTSEMNREGVVYVECSVKFPTINTLDLEYADSAEYIIDKWKAVGKFLTYLSKYPIEIDKYTEE